jgi:organic radical activating enzyme
MKIRVSETFFSFQGEGRYTGTASVWVRVMGCNKQCKGFGQASPELPDTYVIRHIDVSQYSKMEDLPVLDYGCDSDYSVSAKYKHLATDYTEETLADKIYSLLPNKTFKPHPVTQQSPHLCFTGGEPMMQQRSIMATITVMLDRGDFPTVIQIETNGSIAPKEEFVKYVNFISEEFGIAVCFNISPKLKYVSGEPAGVDYEVIHKLLHLGYTADLKFVMNNNDKAWAELDTAIKTYEELYGGLSNHMVFVMPMGATKESQETDETKRIVYRALNNGYHVSGRLHAHLLGNGMNT